jgi:hypothetical protein
MCPLSRLAGWLRSELCLGVGVDVGGGVIQLVNLQAGGRGRQAAAGGRRQAGSVRLGMGADGNIFLLDNSTIPHVLAPAIVGKLGP